MRIVEVIADKKHAKTLAGMARFYGALDHWPGGESADGRYSLRMLVPDANRQGLIDALQDLFKAGDRARIIVQPVDATLTHEGSVTPSVDDKQKRQASSTREELYTQIERGAQLNGNYLILIVLSTLVATIGLLEDNVAIVIGAMVIAPLLGPNIALAFATSLGDKDLSWRALTTNAAGIGLTLAISISIALILPVELDNQSIVTRTTVDMGGVVLGLASGAAAVLSLTTGLSATLVGVMVAVALLPPTATMGMMIGTGQWEAAFGAFLLLTTNIVCVLLSAKLVFLLKGVRPRSWIERNRAKQSIATYFALWGFLLALLIAVILARTTSLPMSEIVGVPSSPQPALRREEKGQTRPLNRHLQTNALLEQSIITADEERGAGLGIGNMRGIGGAHAFGSQRLGTLPQPLQIAGRAGRSL